MIATILAASVYIGAAMPLPEIIEPARYKRHKQYRRRAIKLKKPVRAEPEPEPPAHKVTLLRVKVTTTGEFVIVNTGNIFDNIYDVVPPFNVRRDDDTSAPNPPPGRFLK